MKKAVWILFGFLCVIIGLYPLLYVFVDNNVLAEVPQNLLFFKDAKVINALIWKICFYIHIVLGGLALLIGWLQFSKKLRANRMQTHRTIGKIYTIAVLISGIAGLYIALFATGGIVSILGFFTLAVIWLIVTFLAYKAVKNGNITLHKNLMIYSYAATFAAVTLRIWLPFLIFAYEAFIPAYRVVAWLCWVPNLIVAYFIVNKSNSKKSRIA